jgi:hypothetical protein
MMKIWHLLLLFCTGCLTRGYCQNYDWAKSIGGKEGDGAGTVLTNSLGEVYTLGFFNDTVDFDPGIGVHKLISTSMYGDTYILKTDSLGNYIWAKSIGGTGMLFTTSMTMDSLMNIYILGVFYGQIDFDPGPSVYNISSIGGGYDVYVLKLNSAGHFVWAKSIGQSGNDILSSQIRYQKNGFIYFTGSFHTQDNNAMDFDPGPGVCYWSTSAEHNAYVTKWDTAGNFIWTQAFVAAPNSASGSGGTSLVTDNAGNVLVTGNFNNYFYDVDFDPGPAVYTLTSQGASEIFITKLNANGNFVWAKSLGGIGDEYCSQIEKDNSGNIYSTGYFTGMADFDPGPFAFYFTSMGSYDVFVSKLDPLGNYIWCKTFGAAGPDQSTSLGIDKSGNVVVAGGFSLTVDFDPGPGVKNLSCMAYWDMFMLKLDPLGNYMWAGSVPTLGTDSLGFSCPNALTIDRSDNYYFSGQYYGPVDINPDYGTVTITPVGNRESFLLKLGKCSVHLQSSPNLTICSGECCTLYTSGASVYSWQSGMSSKTEFEVCPNTTSVISIHGYLSENCWSEDSIKVTVDLCTTLKDEGIQNLMMEFYPNPGNGYLTFNTPVATQIRVYSELGELVFEEKAHSGNNRVDLSFLQAGVYFITTNSQGHYLSQKFILVR